MARDRAGAVARWSVAGVLLAAGVICTLVGLALPAANSFGWFAYAPLADAVFIPGLALFTSPVTAAGVALIVAGLIAAAFSLGWSLAARRL